MTHTSQQSNCLAAFPRSILLCAAMASIPLCGCHTISGSGGPQPATVSAEATSPTNRSERVFHYIPKQHFSTCQKANPFWWFRNADDPIPPENYRPGKCCRNFMWHLRNPCHNFTFYVMGIEDKPHTRVGPFPTKTSNPNGGWNWAVCQYKCLRLPFVDYKRGRFEFYFGWRTGGNFGIKLNFKQHQAQKKAS